MNALDFLRDVGKTITVSYMLSKESVQRRLESGISFTEFSYQLLQGFDFQCLFEKYNCILQMGGSDQWGNITAGTEFIRRNLGKKAYAICTPLLTKADGTKFGKSEKGNIWLDARLTTPYQFYQFWINCNDADLPKFLRYFSLKSKVEIEALTAEFATNPNGLKRVLAEELTKRVHSESDYQNVLKVSDILFGKADKETLMSLSAESLAEVAEEIGSSTISRADLEAGIGILNLMSEITKVAPSNSEARKAIQNNAVSVNKDKIKDTALVINASYLLHNQYIMIENGKKNKHLLIVK
jgi:tyrosyl-tRNA synthetase